MRIFFILLTFIPQFVFAQQTSEGNLLGQWSDPALVGSNAYDNTYNEVWGVARNGHEYAILGSTAGTHFIDVTDPANPTEAFFIEGAATGGAIIHRDYHDYGDYLYAVADEGLSTLQILDLSALPDSLPVLYDSFQLLTKAHNIFIDSTQAMLYCFATKGGAQAYSALRLYSIADPLQPEFVGEYNQFSTLTVGHVHDGFVRDGIAFLNCGNDGFAIVDFNDPANPVTKSILTTYTQNGYNHSGWLSESCDYYYMADENHNKDIKVVDVKDICEIEVTGTFDEGTPVSGTIPHNQVVACDYLYASYYYNGLRVYDISNPAEPELAMFYNTSSVDLRNSYEGAWGVYPFLPSGNILVSDMQEGLFVIEGMADACTSTAATPQSQCAIDCGAATSTADLRKDVERVQLSPQPAQDVLTIELTLKQSQQNVNVDILDINGREVARLGTYNFLATKNQERVTLPSLTKGLYLLRFSNAEMQFTEKLLMN
ncbi:MAG: choice-of-anchor B family protein [Saprospiraceae bacterium]